MKTLDRPTLVLNRGWVPVSITIVSRALVAVWNDRAKVVDPDTYQTFSWDEWCEQVPREDEPVIRTGHSAVRVPQIIVLCYYDRVPIRKVPFSRSNLFRRDNHTCQYCGDQPSRQQLTIDHIVPKSRGGNSSWENCVLACAKCNTRKADRTPQQAGMPLKGKPQRPRWSIAFASDHMEMESWSKFLGDR